MIRISVIVPARNAADTIASCLEGLLAQTVPRDDYEVIVVDDGSTDETRSVVEQFDVILVVQSHKGPAAARNRGVNASRGEVLLFTDADCEPAPTWIAEMVEPFETRDIVGVKGVYATRQRGVVPRFVQCEYEERYDLMARRKYIDFVDTYSAGYRRATFLWEKGFDTRYPTASVEDQELSFRLAKRGHKMVFNPEAVVYHQHPETLGAYFRRKFNIGYWKLKVLQSYPDKAMRDSHTPQTLKAQMALVMILLVLAPLSVWRSGFLCPTSIGVVFFCGSVIPFSLRALLKDPAVGLVSPFLLFVRGLALGLGMIKGGWDLVFGKEASS